MLTFRSQLYDRIRADCLDRHSPWYLVVAKLQGQDSIDGLDDLLAEFALGDLEPADR